MNCINKGLEEYQLLKKMAGIQEPILDFWCLYFINKYNRFPYLDELPKVNSEKYLLEKLNVKSLSNSKIAVVDDLLELTGKDNFEEAMIALNNVYRDLQITGVNVGNGKFFIEVAHRPTAEMSETNYLDNYEDNPVNNRTVLINALSKLKQFWGIDIIQINQEDFDSEELQGVPELARHANAFVFNGNIYVNTDNADITAPIHELLHIFLGGMRYTDPNLYMSIIGKCGNVNIEELTKMFGQRSEADLLEEYFVTEFSKSLCGYTTEFDSFSEEDLQLLMYNILRNIDSVLMGNVTVKTLTSDEIVNGSLLDLAIKTKSEILNRATLTPLDLAKIHRQVANIKLKLIESGDLIQNCD